VLRCAPKSEKKKDEEKNNGVSIQPFSETFAEAVIIHLLLLRMCFPLACHYTSMAGFFVV
jgi:hypothetical protein